MLKMEDLRRSEIQKKVLDSIPSNTSGQLWLSPRLGKSKLMIDYIMREKPKTVLWVTPSRKLANKDIPEEFNKWFKDDVELPLFKAETWSSLNKLEGEYDLIILDELHKITEANSENIKSGSLKGKIIIGMTGTPTRDKKKLEVINQFSLPLLYHININKAVELGLLADYTINVVSQKYDYKDKYLNNILKAIKPIGTYYVEEASEGSLVSAKLTLKYGDKVVDKDLFKEVSSKGKEYYKIITSLGSNQGFLMGNELFGKTNIGAMEVELREGKIYTGNSSMRLNAYTQLKKSPQKLQIAKNLLSSLKGKRNMIFAGNIKQAEELSPTCYYHSKTVDLGLQDFIDGYEDTIALVEAGSVGFTYKDIDNLIVMQTNSNKNGTISQMISRTLLKQPEYKATVWLILLRETIDEKWVEETLEDFDINKVKFIEL